MYDNNTQKGSAIYFAVISLAVVLGIAFGLNVILFGGLDIVKRTGNSAIAFYAAEAGAENILFEDRVCVGDTVCLQAAADAWGGGSGLIEFSNGASYMVTVEDSGAECEGIAYCAQSLGTFQQATRKIEIER